MRAWLLLVVACSSEKQQPPPHHDFTGTLSLDNAPLVISKCHAGHAATTFVEVVTDKGKLRFEDRQLFWSADPAQKGDKLDCEKLDRSWGGGQRADGTAYFRGHLIFACHAPVAIRGDIMLDCGAITAQERSELDKNRQDMLDEQAAARDAL
jgi:hypothetical protein